MDYNSWILAVRLQIIILAARLVYKTVIFILDPQIIAEKRAIACCDFGHKASLVHSAR